MTALTQEVGSEFDELGDYMADIVAPQVAAAVAREDAAAIDELITGLSRQELFALVVVLADQRPRPRLRPEDGDIDEVAVRRAAAGYPVLLTRTERDLAVHLMARKGEGREVIMQRLRLSGTTVHKILSVPPPVQDELFEEIA